MNVTTQKFLNEFTPKLEKLFHKELSSVYLESMDEHLRTFYNDVLTELENKQSAMSTRIEGKVVKKCSIYIIFNKLFCICYRTF